MIIIIKVDKKYLQKRKVLSITINIKMKLNTLKIRGWVVFFPWLTPAEGSNTAGPITAAP